MQIQCRSDADIRKKCGHMRIDAVRCVFNNETDQRGSNTTDHNTTTATLPHNNHNTSKPIVAAHRPTAAAAAAATAQRTYHQQRSNSLRASPTHSYRADRRPTPTPTSPHLRNYLQLPPASPCLICEYPQLQGRSLAP
jgi:hypothetical protein